MIEEILRMEYISKFDGEQRILQNVSINLFQGEIVKLVGEYTGRTTLLEILSGSASPDEGSLYIRGKEAVFNSPKASRGCGIAIVRPQNKLLPSMTVLDCLFLDARRLGRGYSNERRDQCCQILSFLGLKASPETHLSEMEKTEAQLLELGRALLKKPKIVIADLAQIPIKTQAVYRKVFAELSNCKCAVLVLSNDIDLFTDIAERIYIMSKGCIVGNIKTEMFDRHRILNAIAANVTV